MHHLHTQFVASCPSHNHSIPGILRSAAKQEIFASLCASVFKFTQDTQRQRGKFDLYFNPQDESKRGERRRLRKAMLRTSRASKIVPSRPTHNKKVGSWLRPWPAGGWWQIRDILASVETNVPVNCWSRGKYATGGRFWLLIVHGSHPSTRYLDSTHDAATAAARRPYLTHRPFDPDDRFAGMVTPNA